MPQSFKTKKQKERKNKGGTINFKLLMIGTMFAYSALYVLSEHHARGGYNNDSNERDQQITE